MERSAASRRDGGAPKRGCYDHATAMITRVYLVRHGATELSAEDRFAGAIDVLLSDAGRDQARRLGARLSGEAIAVAYASPFQQTMETARLIAAPHAIEVRRADGLREIAH